MSTRYPWQAHSITPSGREGWIVLKISEEVGGGRDLKNQV